MQPSSVARVSRDPMSAERGIETNPPRADGTTIRAMRARSTRLFAALVSAPRVLVIALLCASAQARRDLGTPPAPARIPNPWLGAASRTAVRNALVIWVDDIAQDDLDEVIAAGHAPNIAQLAAEGWTFEPTPGMLGGFGQPVCGPARASFCYSRYDFADHGVGCVPFPGAFDPALVSIGDVGTSAGCVTMLAGKWHLGANPLGGNWWETPALQGFDIAAIVGGNMDDCGCTDFFHWSLFEYPNLGTPQPTVFVGTYEPQVVEQRLLANWDSYSGSKLFVLSTSLAHLPVHLPPAYTDDGDDSNDFLPPGYVVSGGGPRPKYLAEIAALDMEVGRVLEHVDPANTLVFFLADNGTPANVVPLGHAYDGTPYQMLAKTTVFERGIRVPFLVWGAGITPAVHRRGVAIEDVLPTLCDYYGLPLPAGIDGVSLVGAKPRNFVIAGIEGGALSDYCCRTARWKLRYKGDSANRVEQVFDLVNDPKELFPRPVSVLAPQLRAWMRAKLAAAGVQ